MKAISNIDTLNEILEAENKDWKKVIFERLGVCVMTNGRSQDEWELGSICGIDNLDADTETSEQGVVLNNMEELAAYIESMPTYQNKLKDRSYGAFSKAELFWSIQDKVTSPNRYGDGEAVYGFKGIIDKPGNVIELELSMCGYDQLGITEFTLDGGKGLDDIVKMVAADVREFRNSLGDGEDYADVPSFRFEMDAEIKIPETFDEVMEKSKDLRF